MGAYQAGPFVTQSRTMDSSLRNIPSPEQGASTRILSKYSGIRAASFSGSSLETQMPGRPNSSRFFSRALALELLMSLAKRRPVPLSFAPSSVLFPPGAAHRSRTRSPGSTGSRAAGAMALGSWM